MLRIVAASGAAAVMVPQAVLIFSDDAYSALKPTLEKLCVRSDAHTRVWVLRGANIPVNWCPYHCSAGRPLPHRPSIVRERPTAHCTRARARAPACGAHGRRCENQGGARAGHFHHQGAPHRRGAGSCWVLLAPYQYVRSVPHEPGPAAGLPMPTTISAADLAVRLGACPIRRFYYYHDYCGC